MIYAVILAGGVGSRFWPFSRELAPKQFIQVLGKDSLLQASVTRLLKRVGPANIFLATNSAYLQELKRQAARFHIPEKNIIVEPESKDTAAAIGLCARLIGSFDKDALLIVSPCDHHIANLKEFDRSIDAAIKCAAVGYLVTIGIKPRAPSAGYGYIELKPGRGRDFQIVKRFLEKPDIKKARRYLRSRNFLWNSGIFVWKCSVFMDELRLFLPQLYSQLQNIESAADIARVWPQISPISVDYGILEHSKKAAVIPARFEWSDLGSWDALENIFSKDSRGNILQADCLDLGSSQICVYSKSSRLISTVGLKDLIIVDTPDALLVCDKHRTQEVKRIAREMRRTGRKEYFAHTTEKRSWGHYTVLHSAKGYKIKIIEIEPKKKISFQRHRERAEHWVVVSGRAKVTKSNQIKFVQSNQSIYIAKGIKHRLENPGLSPLKIVEVQTGNYLEEDDIERFSD